MWVEFIKFFVYASIIVLIAKYILVKILRNLAYVFKLKAKDVGNIAGIATSIPEFLTVTFSAYTGLIGTSIFNILSSNIINFFQYILSIFINKNQKKLQNMAIKTDLILVLITIIIPIILIITKTESNIILLPIFVILFLLFLKISKNAHRVYIKNEINLSDNVEKKNKSALLNILGIIVVGIALYYIGNLLSNTLEILCTNLGVPEFILGVLLGIITSIPEFITFVESQKYHNQRETNEGVVEATSNLLFSNLMNLFIIQSIGIIIFLIFA